MNTPRTAPIQYPGTSTRPSRWKCVAARANASSVSTWAIAARSRNGTCRSRGASEAL